MNSQERRNPPYPEATQDDSSTLPGTGKQSFRSEWGFPTVSTAPHWPQTYSDTSVSTLSTGGIFTPTAATEWNPSDASFENPGMWDEWDELEVPDIGVLNSTGTSFSLGSGPAPPTVGQLGSGEMPVVANPFQSMPTTQQPSSWEAQIMPSSGYPLDLPEASWALYAPAEPQRSSPSQTVQQDTRKPARRNSAKSTRGIPPKPLNKRSLVLTAPPLKSPLKTPTRYRKSSTSSLGGSYPTPDSITTATGDISTASRQERGKTEQKYRSNLNDHFDTLLEALPQELVSVASGIGARSDKPVSKIDILDLAQKHIHELERQQAELKEESLVLRGQTELFQRLLVATGRPPIP